ncbi:hypothetical protein AAMO2058_001394600 [Amorphochlora amoebiformis]
MDAKTRRTRNLKRPYCIPRRRIISWLRSRSRRQAHAQEQVSGVPTLRSESRQARRFAQRMTANCTLPHMASSDAGIASRNTNVESSPPQLFLGSITESFVELGIRDLHNFQPSRVPFTASVSVFNNRTNQYEAKTAASDCNTWLRQSTARRAESPSQSNDLTLWSVDHVDVHTTDEPYCSDTTQDTDAIRLDDIVQLGHRFDEHHDGESRDRYRDRDRGEDDELDDEIDNDLDDDLGDDLDGDLGDDMDDDLGDDFDDDLDDRDDATAVGLRKGLATPYLHLNHPNTQPQKQSKQNVAFGRPKIFTNLIMSFDHCPTPITIDTPTKAPITPTPLLITPTKHHTNRPIPITPKHVSQTDSTARFAHAGVHGVGKPIADKININREKININREKSSINRGKININRGINRGINRDKHTPTHAESPA